MLFRLVRGEHAAHLGAPVTGVVVEEARGRITYPAARLGDRLSLFRHDEVRELLLPGPGTLGYRPQGRPALYAGLAGPTPSGSASPLRAPVRRGRLRPPAPRRQSIRLRG